jgi:hypothetical protein
MGLRLPAKQICCGTIHLVREGEWLFVAYLTNDSLNCGDK